MKGKIATLDKIQQKYEISYDLYDELRKLISLQHQYTKFDISQFQDELPYQLRLKLAKEIHEKVYKNVNFFLDKSMPFMAWIGPMLIPIEY